MKQVNDFQLTEHFSYREMTRSAWAERRGVDNTPDNMQLAALENLCRLVLEPLRTRFGPIRINSGYRSPEVNSGVRGVGNSKHLSGEAADIGLPDRKTGRAYYDFLCRLPFIDQLLFEYTRSGTHWIHVSSCLDPSDNRHQCIPNYLA